MRWEVKRLGDVCNIVNGGTPDTKVKHFWDGDLLWITPKDMGRMRTLYVHDTERKISDAGLKNSSARLLPVGSVILSSRAPIGHLAISKKEVSTNQGCKGLVPKENLDTHFLFYFLKASVELLNSLGTGTTFKELSASKLADVRIPLPPLSEQRRIVAILDEAFAGIAKSKEATEKNRLAEREIFEAELEKIFREGGEGWLATTLEEVTSLITCGVAARPEYVSEGVPFLSAKNVKRGEVIWQDHQFVSEITHRTLTKNNKPKRGDILYTRVGSYGEAAVVESDAEFSIFVSLTLIKTKPDTIDAYFLKYFLNSPIVKRLAKQSISGSGVGNLNVGAVRKFPIRLPLLSEQIDVVARLDTLSIHAQNLEALYTRKLAVLDELQRSLLQKAFAGELTKSAAAGSKS